MNTPDLIKKARNGEATFFIQFGGQGNSFLREARILFRNYPELRGYFETVFRAVDDFMSRPDVMADSKVYYSYGFDLRDWLEHDIELPEEYLYRCTFSFPANQVVQLAYWHLANLNGYDTEELLSHSVGTTGHSQGLQAAVVIGLGKGGEAFYPVLYDFVYWFCSAGYFCQKAYGLPEIPEDILALSWEMDKEKPTPMAVVAGLNEKELLALIDDFNEQLPANLGLSVSLKNTETVMVLTGHAWDLTRFRKATWNLFRERGITFNYLPVSAPFHREDFIRHGWDAFVADDFTKEFSYKGSDLKIPVYSFFDGQNLQSAGRLSELMADIMVMRPLYWEKAIAPLFTNEKITHVLDFGPGKISTLLTKSLIPHRNIEVICAVGRVGLAKLLA